MAPEVSKCVSFILNNNEFQETIIQIVGDDSNICLHSNILQLRCVTTAVNLPQRLRALRKYKFIISMYLTMQRFAHIQYAREEQKKATLFNIIIFLSRSRTVLISSKFNIIFFLSRSRTVLTASKLNFQ